MPRMQRGSSRSQTELSLRPTYWSAPLVRCGLRQTMEIAILSPVYTFQPRYVMDLLGKERAIEPAWELNKYFIHGGGIAIFGEMYWNGGYFCVWFATTLVLLLAYLVDTRRDKGFEWLILYCMYTSCLGYGVGYGLTYLFCGVSNGLIVIVSWTGCSGQPPESRAAVRCEDPRIAVIGAPLSRRTLSGSSISSSGDSQ